MNHLEFQNLVNSRILFLDGATGSNLMKRGMPAGVCPEEWILEHKDVFIELQQEYVEAGSDIIYAPTFTANRVKLAEYGLENEIERINKDLVALSKIAAGKKALVAADITMTGKQLAPMGPLEFEELVEIYKEQIKITVEAGVDLIVVETMMSLQETRAALIAAKEVCELPVLITMTFEPGGKTLFGTDAMTAAVTLSKLGAAAIGANCSTGPEQMAEIIKEMRSVVSIPIIAKPNAGIPQLNDKNETIYDMNEADFVQGMKILIESGASLIGGCCGTSPAYIKAIHDAFYNESAVLREKQLLLEQNCVPVRYLTSERKTVAFHENSRFMIVGERINPTGKKKLQAELLEGKTNMVLEFAEQQEECGAQLLDINVGMAGIDEKETMLKVLDEVTLASSLPLAIDTSHPEVMEAALRRYPGRALINSISAEKEKIAKLLPLAKKYGAMFILLPLSDKGLPASIEEKTQLIKQIADEAFAIGLTKEDIIVDGLVTTVGANQSAALEVLETIRYCKENGYATICGLSNISFGLPERSAINATFLTMAIREGLTMAIANPSQDLLVNTAFAADLLLNKEEAGIAYIERIEAYKERAANVVPVNAQAQQQVNVKETKPSVDLNGKSVIYTDVLKGNRKEITVHTKDALDRGESADEILNSMLLPAIEDVGVLFDKGRYFLPQLIASAETMKLAVDVLEPLLQKGNEQMDMPLVIMATVAGDIHDIGKNLVVMMLKNYGFRVTDLGKDVPAELIVSKAKELKASLVGLSALMTTTMLEMKHVTELLKRELPDVKVMIGGAVITDDYRKEIGADGYAKDAQEAVSVVRKILDMNE